MLHVRRIIAALLLSGSLLGAIATHAFAASHARVSTFEGKADCGSPNTNFPIIGFVKFHRFGNTVDINYHLKNAAPNTTYTVELWQPTPCSLLATVGSVTTNQKGEGDRKFETTVSPTSTQFFATSTAPSPLPFFNDTTTVTLLP